MKDMLSNSPQRLREVNTLVASSTRMISLLVGHCHYPCSTGISTTRDLDVHITTRTALSKRQKIWQLFRELHEPEAGLTPRNLPSKRKPTCLLYGFSLIPDNQAARTWKTVGGTTDENCEYRKDVDRAIENARK